MHQKLDSSTTPKGSLMLRSVTFSSSPFSLVSQLAQSSPPPQQAPPPLVWPPDLLPYLPHEFSHQHGRHRKSCTPHRCRHIEQTTSDWLLHQQFLQSSEAW